MAIESSESAEGARIIVPPLVGPLGAILLLALVRRTRGRAMSTTWFLMLPPVAFGMQEVAERAADVTSLPSLGAEPGLLAAVAVQLPFAVIAFLLARLLLHAVRRVVEILRVPGTVPHIARSVPMLAGPLVAGLVPGATTGAHTGRGPPAFA